MQAAGAKAPLRLNACVGSRQMNAKTVFIALLASVSCAVAAYREPAAVLDLTDPVSVAFVGGCPDGGSTQGKLVDAGGREYHFFIDRRLQTKTYGRWYVGEDVHTGKADLLAGDDARIAAIQAVLLAWLNRVTTMDDRKRLAKLDRAPPVDETWSTDEKLQAHAKWFIARHFMKTTD